MHTHKLAHTMTGSLSTGKLRHLWYILHTGNCYKSLWRWQRVSGAIKKQIKCKTTRKYFSPRSQVSRRLSQLQITGTPSVYRNTYYESCKDPAIVYRRGGGEEGVSYNITRQSWSYAGTFNFTHEWWRNASNNNGNISWHSNKYFNPSIIIIIISKALTKSKPLVVC